MARNFGYSQIKAQSGFTLIEFSIVLMIGGLLLVAGLSLYRVYFIKDTLDATKETHKSLEEALLNYVNENQRLPCPAGPARLSSAAQYGTEDVGGCGVDVTGALNGGVLARPPAGPNQVLIGTIPFRALGVREALTRDGYGRRLTYAVTRALTLSGSMPTGSPFPAGLIRVNNASGVELTNPTARARYVIVSHGANGRGAYARNGSRSACPTTAVSPTEKENCDDDNQSIFVIDYAQKNYDDVISYDFLVNASSRPPLCSGSGALQWDGVQWTCKNGMLPAAIAQINNGVLEPGSINVAGIAWNASGKVCRVRVSWGTPMSSDTKYGVTLGWSEEEPRGAVEDCCITDIVAKDRNGVELEYTSSGSDNNCRALYPSWLTVVAYDF